MTNENSSGAERRDQTKKMIKQLQDQRQLVWSSYCKFAGVESSAPNEALESLVEEFCQILVDYISLGHFGIYQRIVDGKERRSSVISVAEQVYPRIADTTKMAVAFNDKHEGSNSNETYANFAEDLSELGEALATRIEMEDQLISAMVGDRKIEREIGQH